MQTIITEEDFIGMRGECRCCGYPVARYTCNQPLIEKRPEGECSDWWASCSNKNCENHYGQGYFQRPLGWVKYDWQETK